MTYLLMIFTHLHGYQPMLGGSLILVRTSGYGFLIIFKKPMVLMIESTLREGSLPLVEG
jgi:hypothetical protein